MEHPTESERVIINICANIRAWLEHEGFRVSISPYSDPKRKSVVMLVNPEDPTPGLYAVEVWKYSDKSVRVVEK